MGGFIPDLDHVRWSLDEIPWCRVNDALGRGAEDEAWGLGSGCINAPQARRSPHIRSLLYDHENETPPNAPDRTFWSDRLLVLPSFTV
ncbi:MAG: hypothetical protein D6690_09605 [Nitrospirae bacterium]|nr:MAG: hypothetical protein D6690_09605 [Nitrospirota bacterium]